MKYCKKFDQHEDYIDAFDNNEIMLHNVSYCKDDPHTHYDNYQLEYLTLIALEDTTFTFVGTGISYSLDNGEWTSLGSGVNTPTVYAGHKIRWKGTITPGSAGVGCFTSTGLFNAEGNPMSLLFGDNFKFQYTLPSTTRTLRGLFTTAPIVSAKNMVLPATTLTLQCYAQMFQGCTSLIEGPKILPAETLTTSCYNNMFYGCTSLTTTPELPATTLADSCYSQMFYGCTSLTTAPSILPATEVKIRSYYRMFIGCSSLTEAPELPATTIADMCYDGMFLNCAALIKGPSILPAMTLVQGCYEYMFANCQSLTRAPILPAENLVSACYYNMFFTCNKLTYLKAMFLDFGENYQETALWLSQTDNVKGIFVMNENANWDPDTILRTGGSVPPTWTVVKASD